MESSFGISIFLNGSKVITPAKGKPFYIFQLSSVAEAFHLRTSCWKSFAQECLFVGEDLTRLEQDNVNVIVAALKVYWNRTFIPSTLFSRDKLKCHIDGDNSTLVRLDREEVLKCIDSKRLN